ncbi:hypothetical protein ATZ36_11240 [Candidatus Endomicrobiellum trichonymphae]|uniref:Uncharacterized protein n=1 Tax=Endomicrobium trichonymphae TaxID=1408204 RepID=A0A1E5IF70_ENDTX|nr:hypothetical protein ATZ36_11240 [Candidatus Endomicrobium trichonymphae]
MVENSFKRYNQKIKEFEKLKTETYQYCLSGDTRTIDIVLPLSKKQKYFADILNRQKNSGIFSSPPYVDLIDYHEQHAYFGFERKDELETGSLLKGQGREAPKSYAEGISDILNNCKKYLKESYNVF